MNLKGFAPRSFALTAQAANFLLILGGKDQESKLSDGIILDMTQKKRIATFDTSLAFSSHSNQHCYDHDSKIVTLAQTKFGTALIKFDTNAQTAEIFKSF